MTKNFGPRVLWRWRRAGLGLDRAMKARAPEARGGRRERRRKRSSATPGEVKSSEDVARSCT